MGVPEDSVLTLESDAFVIVFVYDMDLVQPLALAVGRLKCEMWCHAVLLVWCEEGSLARVEFG